MLTKNGGVSPKNTCCHWYLSEVHRQEAGTHMTSFTRVLCWEKRYHEDIWWAGWGTAMGNFWGWKHLGILECFLLSLLFFSFFFFPIFWLTLQTIAKERNCPKCIFGCKATSYISLNQPDSIFAAQQKYLCGGFTALSPYNYISKGGKQTPRAKCVWGQTSGGYGGCSITSVPISLGCRAGLLTPCQAPQVTIHLKIPGKNLSKLTSFATRKVTCLVSPWGILLLFREVSCIWRWNKNGEKKKGKVSDLLGSPLPLKEIN